MLSRVILACLSTCLFALTLVISSTAFAQPAAPTCRTPQVEERIKDLNSRIKRYEARKAQAEADLDAAEKYKDVAGPAMSLNERRNNLDNLKARLSDFYDELNKLERLPPCPPPHTEFPFGPNGPFETASFEFSGYSGSVAASSFGSDFNPNVWGGRAVARMPIGQFRLQTDIQGERTNDYSSIAGNRSYFAGGVHADWMWATNTEVGAFGGLQNATPTFQGPTSTNYFVGLEGRQFFGPAMVGVQFGRFDVTNGPGTLTDAWFVEGRAKFSLGEAFRIPALKYTIIGGNLGYGSGTASAVLMGAQTTYWGLGLTQGIVNTPIRLSLTYDHFENRVDGLGLVWKENKLMGGVKLLFPSTDVARGRIEPTVPLPYILGTVMTF
jgi:hypothetical protein